MSAAQTAQALGLDAHAVAAFTGSPGEFAQHFGVSVDESPASGGAPANLPPGAPTNLKAVIDGTTKQITLTWDAPASPGSFPIIGYEVTYLISPATTAPPEGNGHEEWVDAPATTFVSSAGHWDGAVVSHGLTVTDFLVRAWNGGPDGTATLDDDVAGPWSARSTA